MSTACCPISISADSPAAAMALEAVLRGRLPEHRTFAAVFALYGGMLIILAVFVPSLWAVPSLHLAVITWAASTNAQQYQRAITTLEDLRAAYPA